MMFLENKNGGTVNVDGRFVGDALVFFDKDGSVEEFLDNENGEDISVIYGEDAEHKKLYKSIYLEDFKDLSIMTES